MFYYARLVDLHTEIRFVVGAILFPKDHEGMVDLCVCVCVCGGGGGLVI